LHSRFGRAWRRKAPVESMMPLRLARYGVPLAETAPSGLAAAGIEPALLPPAPVQVAAPAPVPATPEASEHRELESEEPRPVQVPASAPERSREPEASVEKDAERFAVAYQAFIAEFQAEPTPAQLAFWLRDTYGISTGSGGPLSEEQVRPLLQVLQARYAPDRQEPAASETAEPADQSWDDYFYSAWRTFQQERGFYPHADALAAYLYERDFITGADGQPITGEDLAGFVAGFQEREFGSSEPPAEGSAADPGGHPVDETLREEQPESEPAGVGAQAAKEKRIPRVSAAIDDPPPGPGEATGERTVLTTVDRYYLAWTAYLAEHGDESTAEQLSADLAEKGMHGRGGKPVSPATLRRYFLPFRVYNVWAEDRMRSEQPASDAIAQACAARGITAQYNKPVTPDYITENAVDFERRWHALIRHEADAQQ
ncbi:hypothetical protein AB0E09_49195, partial [Streptomyces mirabilis]